MTQISSAFAMTIAVICLFLIVVVAFSCFKWRLGQPGVRVRKETSQRPQHNKVEGVPVQVEDNDASHTPMYRMLRWMAGMQPMARKATAC